MLGLRLGLGSVVVGIMVNWVVRVKFVINVGGRLSIKKSTHLGNVDRNS